MARASILLLPLLVFGLAACERMRVLPGERFGIDVPLAATIPDESGVAPASTPAPDANREAPIRLGAARNLAEWPLAQANLANQPGHLAFNAPAQLAWALEIGLGNDRRHRLTADPVVAGGRIYVMDSIGVVSAVSPAGALLWRADLTSRRATDRPASGGGLAFGSGALYVTTGYGDLHALDPATGAIRWTHSFDAPASAAPTIAGNSVYVVTRDNRGWALDAATGRVRWNVRSAPSDIFVTRGASPAVVGNTVYMPFGSGELLAVATGNGLVQWSAGVAGQRTARARARILDVTGDPVVDGALVYAANQSGQIVAVNRAGGESRWTAGEGSYSPVAVGGGSVFAITDEQFLVRLDARNGQRIWAAELPGYTTERRPRRIRDVFEHFGPVLVSGQVMVASSDGVIRFFDPVSGRLVSTSELPGGAASQPVIVGGTLYILAANGRLLAFR